MEALRRLVGRGLERGAFGAGSHVYDPVARAVGRAAAQAWERAADARLARPLALPAGVRVVGIGSAVLGGAGKSPIAIALARALARRGEHVALVAHAYRASPSRARVVLFDDAPTSVGDDALAAARLLEDDRVSVFVGPTRQSALDAAARSGASTIVVDGLLQTAPARLGDSLLVLDAEAPWGAGACPPLGDLRATPTALLAAADRVVIVRDRLTPLRASESGALPRGALVLPSDIAGVMDAKGRRRSLAALAGLRVGVLLAIARPERVLRALALRGIEPAVVLALADHARLDAASLDRHARAEKPSSAREPDVWLTTARCAVKLSALFAGRAILALDHRIDVRALFPAGHANPSSPAWSPREVVC